VGGVESGEGVGTWIADVAIVAFVVLLLVSLARTAACYSLLLILPVTRLLRRIPGISLLVERVERHMQHPRA
jgi:hypothetical protein